MTHRRMRHDDMTHNSGRRHLLAAIARLPVLLVAAYTGIFPRLATSQEASGDVTSELDPHQLAVLERLARLLFPLPGLDAAPFERVATGIAEAVRAEPSQLVLVRSGIEQLDAAAGGNFLDLAEAQQVQQLKHIEPGAFFQFVYTATRSRLFDDREVWALLGYEGSSLEKGGYLDRGLNDIDWL